MPLSYVRNPKKVRTFVTKSAQAEEIAPLMVGNVSTDATLITDDHKSYKTVGKGYNHHMVKTEPNSYVTDRHFHTNNIEGFWSQLKRGIIGIYHQVSPKHLQKYCDEFSFKYNTRKENNKDRFVKSVGQAWGKRLKYEVLTSK